MKAPGCTMQPSPKLIYPYNSAASQMTTLGGFAVDLLDVIVLVVFTVSEGPALVVPNLAVLDPPLPDSRVGLLASLGLLD